VLDLPPFRQIWIQARRNREQVALFRGSHGPSTQQKNYPTHYIMILGRWKSDTFMRSIHPQLLELTSNLARDMTDLQDFKDLKTSEEDSSNFRLDFG